MQKRFFKIFILLLLIVIITAGFRCKFVPEKVKKRIEPVKLVYWRVWDSPDSFSQIIGNYRAIHPHIEITYRKLRYEEYERALLEAWAEGRGPDIFSIPNTWLTKYQKFILPLPGKTTMPYVVVTGPACKRTEEIVLKDQPSLSLRDLKNNFVDVVFDDVVRNNQIYALPLSIDTLVLYYNRDLLNNAGIAQPPTNWTELKDDVEKLTIQDKTGNIIQAGIAMGTAENITRSTDILFLLMMQNGTLMTSGQRATFNQPLAADPNYFPGQEALRFYTDFANPAKETYSWNTEMQNSLDAFIEGKVALFFGYAYHLPTIQARAPKLNFGITSAPQIEGSLKQVNYANYWIETVFFKTEYPNETWDFLQFATAQGNVDSYLNSVKKPTALRGLISQQLEDFDLAPFAQQVLTAQSWYHGQDFEAVEGIFKEMITSINGGETDYKKVINLSLIHI